MHIGYKIGNQIEDQFKCRDEKAKKVTIFSIFFYLAHLNVSADIGNIMTPTHTIELSIILESSYDNGKEPANFSLIGAIGHNLKMIKHSRVSLF